MTTSSKLFNYNHRETIVDIQFGLFKQKYTYQYLSELVYYSVKENTTL